MSNSFWDYSLMAYAAPGVAGACLQAQDRFGLDVNLLLYAAWLADVGKPLQADHLASMEEAIVQWRRRAVLPLRRVRRDLKELEDAAALRDQVKALELAAERHQQMLMWRIHGEAEIPGGGASLRDNLATVFAASKAVDASAQSCLATLMEALQGVAEGTAQ